MLAAVRYSRHEAKRIYFSSEVVRESLQRVDDAVLKQELRESLPTIKTAIPRKDLDEEEERFKGKYFTSPSLLDEHYSDSFRDYRI